MSDDTIEVRCTTKNTIGFYIRAARSFLLGQKSGKGKPGRDAQDTLVISGLGNAINAAVTVAGKLVNDGVAEIVNSSTDYPEMTAQAKGASVQRAVPLLRVTLRITEKGRERREGMENRESSSADPMMWQRKRVENAVMRNDPKPMAA